MRRELRDFVVVKVRSVFKDETMYEGHNKAKIFQDVTFNPQKHINNCGIVETTPVDLSREPIYWKNTGIPAYHEDPPYEYRSMEDIQMTVKPGTKVYFNYNVLVPNIHDKLYNHRYVGKDYEEDPITGEMIEWLYFKVKYSQIFCMVEYVKTNAHYKDFSWYFEKHLTKATLPVLAGVDDDEVPTEETRYEYNGNMYQKVTTMIGSWVFVEPDKQTWDDISTPIPETEFGLPKLDPKTGKMIMKPKDQWLVSKAQPQNKYLFGWVRHVDHPLKGDEKELEVGDYVMYRPNTDTPVDIEDKTFHRMIQANVAAKFPLNQTV
jgi:hypothetical protein